MNSAAATGVAREINADPHRLDLDWHTVRRARARGVAISIGADAHSAAGIANVEYGVGIARKAWLGAEEVLNTQPVETFLARTFQLVPVGQESAYMNFDAELEELLSQA